MQVEETNDSNIPNVRDEYFLNILSNVKRHVPEFETDSEKDEQYMIMFEFGEFVIKNHEDGQIFDRCIYFINEALEKGTSITQEVIAIEIFQQLYNKQDILNSTKERLSKDSRIILDYYHLQYRRSYR